MRANKVLMNSAAVFAVALSWTSSTSQREMTSPGQYMLLRRSM
jgi:hypothetical protein